MVAFIFLVALVLVVGYFKFAVLQVNFNQSFDGLSTQTPSFENSQKCF